MRLETGNGNKLRLTFIQKDLTMNLVSPLLLRPLWLNWWRYIHRQLWNIFNQVLGELTDAGKDQFVGINETIPTHDCHVSNTVTIFEKFRPEMLHFILITLKDNSQIVKLQLISQLMSTQLNLNNKR